ncbi:unnamed protein product, partial [Didymodactylos carnosus]
HLSFEDIAIDDKNGITFLSGDNREWFSTFMLPSSRKMGEILKFNFSSEQFETIPLINYKYHHFHPLGISHVVFDQQKAERVKIKFIDDVVAADEQSFYVTTVLHYRPDQSLLLCQFEILTQRSWTNVIFCSKKISNNWKCNVVVDQIKTANGIFSSNDMKTIYVAASIEKKIRVYNRHPDNNSLILSQSLSLPGIPDNVVVNADGQLLVGSHPKMFSFMLHSIFPSKYHSPAQVLLLKKPTHTTFEEILITNGEQLSAATTAVSYKNKLIVGAYLSPGILVCEHLL